MDAWKNLSYPELAEKVLAGFLTDYSADFLHTATASTYGAAFGGKEGETVKVRDGLYSLELWHGPTCAFKDYALQLMPKLLVEAKKMLGRTETTRILVATSGDTGKAALAGYADLDGIEIEVFYPNDGTSEIQHLQMATQKGENVQVYAVQGNFDDAQTGVKKVFADADVAAELEKRGIRLSSANSINWGRLVPQIVYLLRLLPLAEQGEVDWGSLWISACRPGNFGDILAGYYAKQMGLPVGRLVCASNKNNVLTDFIKTGTYDARRTFYKTTSPSMDILISTQPGASSVPCQRQQRRSAVGLGSFPPPASTPFTPRRWQKSSRASPQATPTMPTVLLKSRPALTATTTSATPTPPWPSAWPRPGAPTRRWSCSPRPARSSSRATS